MATLDPICRDGKLIDIQMCWQFARVHDDTPQLSLAALVAFEPHSVRHVFDIVARDDLLAQDALQRSDAVRVVGLPLLAALGQVHVVAAS